MLPQRHQCSLSTTLGQGCSDQGHQCSISVGLLILLNYNWMTPDVVPTRTLHHRFLILRNPSNLAMYLCLWCREKKHLETAYCVHCRIWSYCVWSELNKLIKMDCWTELICGPLHSWQSVNHPNLELSKKTLTTIRSHSHTLTLKQSNWTLRRSQKLQVQPNGWCWTFIILI